MEYIWDGDRLAATRTTDYKNDGTGTYVAQDPAVTRFLYDADGEAMGFTVADTFTFVYRKNIFGDITAIANSNGTIVATYTYDAWGRIRASTDTDPLEIGHVNPLRYRGYYYDTETGFYYLNSRYYNPTWGRFINADSVAGVNQNLQSYNLFAYCCDNPISRFDESGFGWGVYAAGAVVGAAVNTIMYCSFSEKITTSGVITSIGIGALTGAASAANKWWVDLLVSCGLGAYSYYSTNGVPLEKLASAFGTFIAAEIVSLVPSVSSAIFENELRPVLQNGNTLVEKIANNMGSLIIQRNIGLKQEIVSYLPNYYLTKNVHSFVRYFQKTFDSFNRVSRVFSSFHSNKPTQKYSARMKNHIHNL